MFDQQVVRNLKFSLIPIPRHCHAVARCLYLDEMFVVRIEVKAVVSFDLRVVAHQRDSLIYLLIELTATGRMYNLFYRQKELKRCQQQPPRNKEFAERCESTARRIR